MKILVNGLELVTDSPPQYVSGQHYVPIRDLFALLGGTVVWQQRENQAVVKWRHNLFIVPALGRTVWLNGEKKEITHAHLLVDGRLHVALQSMAEAFCGVLRHNSEVQELFLPVGYLQGCSFGNGSLMLQWTGNSAVDVKLQGGEISFELHGTYWPEGLQSMYAERSPQGHVLFTAKLSGNVEHAIGEQGARLFWKSSGQALEGLTIAIDAGHGGAQPGAVGYSGTLEKDLTRRVADRLKVLLSGLGATVIDVRPEDQTTPLPERVMRARQSGAKLFISIHYNAHERRDASGTETFYASGNVKAAELATLVQDELVKALGLRNRGVKQASFHVLQALPDIPAALAEIGFISNPEEEALLIRESNTQLAAEALFNAVQRFWAK